MYINSMHPKFDVTLPIFQVGWVNPPRILQIIENLWHIHQAEDFLENCKSKIFYWTPKKCKQVTHSRLGDEISQTKRKITIERKSIFFKKPEWCNDGWKTDKRFELFSTHCGLLYSSWSIDS